MPRPDPPREQQVRIRRSSVSRALSFFRPRRCQLPAWLLLFDETDTEVRLLLFLRGALSPAAAARAQ